MKGMSRRVRARPVAALRAIAALTVGGLPSRPAVAKTPALSVIDRAVPGAGGEPERATARAGGQVGRTLSIIDNYVASVPADALAGLRTLPGVHSGAENAAVELHDTGEVERLSSNPSSMCRVAQEVTGAGEMWNDGWTGKGVDVALIDSGVVPVDGLRTPRKVVKGPDLSFEAAERRYAQRFPELDAIVA